MKNWMKYLTDAGQTFNYYASKKIQELKKLCNGYKPQADARRRDSWIGLLQGLIEPRGEVLPIADYIEYKERKLVIQNLPTERVMNNLLDLVGFVAPQLINPELKDYFQRLRPNHHSLERVAA